MTVPAGEKCPRCGSVMKLSKHEASEEIWTCLRCKIEKVKKRG